MKSLAAVDLFCGAGGLTRGLLDAGINVRAGFDIDNAARFAYEHNNSPAKFILKDISDLSTTDVAPYLSGANATLLAGCAPCQPFSHLVKSKSRDADSRWNLLSPFGSLVDLIEPDYVTMENVPGLCKTNVFADFLKILDDKGYFVHYDVLDCSEFGVPQRRRRLALVASNRAPIHLPQPSHAPTSAGSALEGLVKLNAGGQDSNDRLHRSAGLSAANLARMKASRPGGTWQDWPSALRLACHQKEGGRGYTDSYGRINPDEPAPPITTKFFNYGSGRFGHPVDDRALTPREAAILQSFPPEYQFDLAESALGMGDLARLIGNAVPVALAKAIGETIRQHAVTHAA